MTADQPANTGEFQVLTGPGPAAIAVIRVRGPQTAAFIAQHVRLHRPHTLTAWTPGRIWRAELLGADGAPIDDILVSVHASPPAWDVRLHLHGNPWLVRHCAELLRTCGLCEYGTMPSGNVGPSGMPLWTTDDALEAEAYLLLPQMLTLRGAHWLLQQVGRLRTTITALRECESPDAVRTTCREIAGRIDIVDWFVRPLRIVLAGPPNVGKSTLANAMADRTVSLVSPTPGTTRDWVEIPGEAAGFPLVWLDTAGLRASNDPLESAGIERTHVLMREADAVVAVLDVSDEPGRATAAFLEAYGDLALTCVALNKCDLGSPAAALRDTLPAGWRSRAVSVSAVRRTGLDALRDELLANLGRSSAALELPAAFTSRQATLLLQAAAASDCNTFNDNMLQIIQPTAPA